MDLEILEDQLYNYIKLHKLHKMNIKQKLINCLPQISHAQLERILKALPETTLAAPDGSKNIWIRRKSKKDLAKHLINSDEGAY